MAVNAIVARTAIVLARMLEPFSVTSALVVFRFRRPCPPQASAQTG
jgi:hypothetical protein